MKVNLAMDNYWIRDFGPVYLVNDKGERKLVVFKYFWNENHFMAEFASLSGLPVINSSLNSSGGAREENGKGTMILSEAHELDVNHPKTKMQIEQEMIDKLNLKKIIWLKKGIPQDDSFLSGPLISNIYPNGVNGHIDEFCRFVDPGTIMVTTVSESEARQHPILDIAKRRLDDNYRILMESTDQDGNTFDIIKVPIAPLIIRKKDGTPDSPLVATVTSYMNFIITNNSVILPSYVNEGSRRKALLNREQHVRDIFQNAFPGREIIRVRADTLNFFSGGFHCISINEPQLP
ncbi:MAG: agmatine deiminase family protein [Bacteroidales bacterium]|nr:agmatine deiminase family protein [Bacteroidales bacterium]